MEKLQAKKSPEQAGQIKLHRRGGETMYFETEDYVTDRLSANQ